ncbi:Hyalin [Holothuria leucospilota]|uniref:Hyalin n=1 Tax=Holothuria leucospilota TaxID=206669 RepID=A0A9Q1BSI0_HOLLE|nr:Hyalin [Holothuria leucospilota]
MFLDVTSFLTAENTQPNPPNCPRSGENITTVRGSLTAVATYGPFVCSDAEQGLIEATCNPVSGSSFNIGQNEVTCTCTDSGGLVSSCNFLVSVTDNTGFNSSPSPPNCPSSSLVLRASEESNSAVANYGTISCSDVQQGSIVATCQPSTGSVFSVGATLVTCICVDDGNLTSSCAFILTVEELQETFPIWLVVVLSAASVFVISLLILMIMLILKRKQPNGKGTNQDTAMTVVADLNHSAAIGSDVYSQPVDGREKTLNEGGKVYSKRIHKYDRTNTRSNKDNTSEQNYSSKVYNEGHYYTVE